MRSSFTLMHAMSEAVRLCGRLCAFNMQEHVPSVMHLQVNLSDEQTVIVNTDQVQNLEEAVNFGRNKATTLIGWCQC